MASPLRTVVLQPSDTGSTSPFALAWAPAVSESARDYAVDLTAWTEAVADTLASVDVQISPAGTDGDLTVAASSTDGRQVLLTLQGGVPGEVYSVRILAVGTDFTNTISRVVRLPIMVPMAPPQALAASSSTKNTSRLSAGAAPDPEIAQSALRPAVHLPKTAAATTVRAALVADSYGLEGPTIVVSQSESLSAQLRQKLMRDTGKPVVWGNFARGGKKWSDFASAATVAPGEIVNGSVQDGTKTWQQLVSDFAPTVVFVALGINDQPTGAAPADVKTALAFLQTLGCDIVLVTGGYGAEATFLGTPFVASATNYNTIVASTFNFMRQLARQGGGCLGVAGLPRLGLLDFNRLLTQARYGLDPDNQYLSQVITAPVAGLNPGAAPYTLPVTAGGDFDVVLTFPDAAAAFAAGTTFSAITFTGLFGEPIVSVLSSGGVWRIDPFVGGGINEGLTAAGAIPTSGDLVLQVTAKSEYLAVRTSGGALLWEGLVPRRSAAMAPKVTLSGSAPPAMTVTSYAGGIPAPCRPFLGDLDVYGAGNGPPTTLISAPNGGDGELHPSDVWSAMVVRRYLEAVCFV